MAVVKKPDWLQNLAKMTVAFADQTFFFSFSPMTSMSISDKHYHNCNIVIELISNRRRVEGKWHTAKWQVVFAE